MRYDNRQQQASQQQLIRQIPTRLCAASIGATMGGANTNASAEHELRYQQALHELLRPVRRAASMHVHAAMYLNAACGITGEEVWNGS